MIFGVQAYFGRQKNIKGKVFFGFWGMVMIGKLDTFGDILKLEESYSLSEVYLTVG